MSRRESDALRDARDLVKRLDTKLATTHRILLGLNERVAEITASIRAAGEARDESRIPALSKSLNSYTSLQSKMLAKLPELVEERKRALARVEELAEVSQAREMWALHMREVKENALIAVAQNARTSGLDPFLVDRLRGLVRPDEAMRRELVPLEAAALEAFLRSNPSEEVLERRFLDLPLTREPWRVLNFCIDQGYERCVTKIVAANPPRQVVQTSIEHVSGNGSKRMLDILTSGGYVPTAEEVEEILLNVLNGIVHRTEKRYERQLLGYIRDTEKFLVILARLGNVLTREQVRNLVSEGDRGAWSAFNEARMSFADIRVAKQAMKIILALYAHPQIQADVTQFPLGGLVYLPSSWEVFDEEENFIITWRQIAAAAPRRRDLDQAPIVNFPAPPTAAQIRAYMRMLAAAFQIDV